MHGFLGVLFVLVGIYALWNPYDTFATLAALVGFFLLIKGIFDISAAFITKDEFELWWMQLVIGLIEILLAFWVAGDFKEKAILLVIYVGIIALARGITRDLRRVQAEGPPSSTRSDDLTPFRRAFGRAAYIGSRSMRRTTLFLCILVAALGLVAAGCGQEQEQTATPETVQGEVTTTTESTETETTETETGSESTETTTTDDRDRRRSADRRPGRRQGGLPRRLGLHRLPHARGRGLVGHRRTEPRRCDAELRPRLRPRDERSGRDALVRHEPH